MRRLRLRTSTKGLGTRDWGLVHSWDECSHQRDTRRRSRIPNPQSLVPEGWQPVRIAFRCEQSPVGSSRGLPRTAKGSGLVVICVLSLGLGVGVNLMLFSLLSAMFFDQPTIASPSEVVGLEPGNSNQLSYLNYRDLKDSGIFESVFGYRRTELSLRTGEMTQRVAGLAVSGNFFDGLGVRAQFGRVFTDAEASPEREARVAVASHAFWRRTLDADPHADRPRAQSERPAVHAARRAAVRLSHGDADRVARLVRAAQRARRDQALAAAKRQRAHRHGQAASRHGHRSGAIAVDGLRSADGTGVSGRQPRHEGHRSGLSEQRDPAARRTERRRRSSPC